MKISKFILTLGLFLVVVVMLSVFIGTYSPVELPKNRIVENGVANDQGGPRKRTRVELHHPGSAANGVGFERSVELDRFQNMLAMADESNMPSLFNELDKFQGEERTIALNMLAARWASINPMRAVEFSANIKDPQLSEKFLLAILGQWPRKDLIKGFDWVASMKNPSQRDQALEVLLSCAVRLDPVLASNYITSLPDGIRKQALLAKIAETWVQSDPDSAIGWVNSTLTGTGKSEALLAIGMHLSKSDPNKAAVLLGQIPFGNYRDSLIDGIATNWIASDEAAAIGWIATLDSVDYNAAVISISSAWGRVNPTDALKFGLNLPTGMKDQFIANILEVWGGSDPAAAVAWVKASGLTLSDDVLHGMFESWAMSKPQDAAAHIGEFTDESMKSALTIAAARNWARKNPVDASEFAMSLAEGPAKIEAIGNVVNHWARSDSMAASKWVSAMDPGPCRDRGILALAGAVLKSDPKSAFEWTLELDDPLNRDKWIQKIGSQWIEDQGEHAISQIKTMGISPSVMKSLGLQSK